MFDSDEFIVNAKNETKEEIGDEKAIIALSGGVDSSVCSALVSDVIGDNLTAIFVNHGLLREGEVEEVTETFKDRLNFHYVDASDEFLDELAGVEDPEEKRKIIGTLFIEVFEREADKMDAKYLVQGTIAPDLIETEGAIKSHHNVVLPSGMELKVVEPVKDLFKPEVRAVGAKLGLPDKVVNRQPFPGPGLAIRVLGDITEDKLRIVRDTDQILRDEVKKANLQNSIWQYFTVLLDCRSVGVMGDQRTYAYAVAIRAITSSDGMTADWAKLPYEVLDLISRRIVNEVKGCNRVVYDITSKPPGTIEWE